MSDKQKLTVVIVNFNAFNEIVNNLEYLGRLQRSIPFKVLIVENGDCREWTDTINQFDFIYVLNPKSNIGFSRANNLAASNCSTDFILFLNPDAIVTEDFITPIISFMETRSSIGVCAPMLISEHGKYQSSTGFEMGFIYELLEAFMFISIYRFFKSLKYKKKVHENEPVKVGWASAACMIVKKSVFESVGGFSEEYFLNYEDIDFCTKLKDKGYLNYYFPFLKCIHLDHRSFNKNYELLVYSRYQSRLIYAECHYGILMKYCVRLIHIFGLALRLVLVNFLYSGLEKRSRTIGYIKSLKLYLGINTKMIQST